MLKLLLIFLAYANAAQDKTIREANKNWLTVGNQDGTVLLQNVPTHYPEWKPAKKVASQSKHGRSPNQVRHVEYPQALLNKPRLRNRRHQRPPGNNL